MALGRPSASAKLIIFAWLGALVAACSSSTGREPDQHAQDVASTTQALWTNGDFEGDLGGVTPPTGWAVSTYLNPTPNGVTGSTSSPPSSFSALNLTAGGKVETSVVSGAAESQIDPDLGSASAFRFPKYGSRGVRVNYKDSTDYGKDRNANGLSQTMTVTASDVDPIDGQVHVRFAIAPVLENPSHGYTQQPYYFVELLNLTRGAALYRDFNTAGQSGVPWITTTSAVTGNTTQWTNWQLIDLSPGSSFLEIGDQVKLTIVGSGCSLGGHFGRVYVDGTGSSVPGPYTWATGPSAVPASSSTTANYITYVIHYTNGGATTIAGVHVDMATPPQTTYSSLSGASNCTAPAAGGTGTISCPIGVLAAGSSGSFTVTVRVNNAATGNIVNGNYSIAAVNNSTLLGARVTTAVIAAGTRNADAVVTQTANKTSVNWNDSIVYTITLANNGPNNLNNTSTNQMSFGDIFPPQLTGVTWSCAATGSNTSCPSATGTGSISGHPRVGSGGNLKFTVTANIISGSGLGSVSNTATAAPGVRPDPNTSNNSSTLTLAIGTPHTLTFTKGGSSASGSVSSAPAGVSCGTGCSSTSATFVDGASVVLTASPIQGASFTGWGGACSSAGTATTCTVAMSADKSVTASFAAAPAVGNATNIYVYSGNNQRARTGVAFGSALRTLVTDSNGIAVNGVAVTYTAVPAGGASATLSGGTASNSAGLSSINATANATAGTYTVSASIALSGGGTASTTFTLINVGNPSAITYVSGGSVTDPNQTPVATAFAAPLMVLVTDSASNPVPGTTVNFSVTPAGGASATLSSATAVTDSDGHASVTATANNTAGSYTATASTAGVVPTVGFKLTNTASTPANVFVVSGNNQDTPTSTAFDNDLEAGVTDVLGNALPNVSVTFTAPASGASLIFSNSTRTITTTTDATGIATVTVPTANATVGNYSVTASVSGVATPATFSMANDGPQLIDVYSGDAQSKTVDVAFSPLVVIVTNSSTGLPIQNVTVTFTKPASGATAVLGSTTATTDVNGLATMTATAGSVAGSYSVSATTAQSGAPAVFPLTNTAGTPTAIAVSAGSGQHAVVNTSFANPIVARVADTHNNPVPNVAVTFTAPGSAPTAAIAGSPATTDAAGLASVTPTAGATAGSYNVAASASGTGSVNFALTNDECHVDSDCASNKFCNTVTLACTPKLANGTAVPTITGHTPALTGACSAAVGAAVCTSGVCSTSDNKCGYINGETTCNGSTAATVCRSQTCSVNGACMAAGGCLVAGDCSLGNASAACSLGACAIASCNTGYGNCNGTVSDGCEKLIAGSDLNNCGGCGTVCDLANASETCTAGSCGLGTCSTGYANCNGTVGDGCEKLIAGSDLNNCGGCGTVCDLANASEVCTAGSCGLGTCSTGYANCNGTVSDGCEKLIAGSDLNNCGGCGTVCDLANASEVCTAGSCGLGTCSTGYANCNGTVSDGCEKLIAGSDLNNCGGCGTVCDLANASETCTAGSCGLGTCSTGYANCNGTVGDGCEKLIAGSDLNNCGGCGTVCDLANASEVCTAGSCGLGTCSTGYANCNGTVSDGCEKLIAGSDLNNCGGCGTVCDLAHASEVCTAGSCGLGTCSTGYANCNSTVSDGCEKLIAGSDLNNCGGCGTVCDLAHASDVCTAGSCGLGTCDAGYANCNGTVSDGCEKLIAGSDLNNCGGCGTPCSPAHASGACTTGTCGIGSCNAGYADCDGNPSNGCEVNIAGSDVTNCGGCGTTCNPVNAVPACNSGTCGIASCNAGYTDCDNATTYGCEVLTGGSDVSNCGGCGSVCGPANASAACTTGTCGIGTCNAGYTDCDNSPSNGCEIHTAADTAHCGGCNTACSPANASAACTSGACGIDTCNTGYTDCDNSPSNGCEVHTDADTAQCGACNNACSLAHADAACTAGDCAVETCHSGYTDCDHGAANGCEVLTGGSDVNNCGGCGTTCGATEFCVTGTCTAKKPNSQNCSDATQCSSGICFGDGACGLPDGSVCATSSVCRGACSVSGVCIPAGGCAVDDDCTSDEFCDTSLSECAAKLPNGTPIPTIAGHDPALSGACTPDVGAIVCVAAVCDSADSQCGHANGEGPCTDDDASVVCRSNVCGSDGKCGYPDGEGSCTDDTATELCRSGLCHNAICSPPPECMVDGDCAGGQFCDTAEQHCTPKLPNGTPIPAIADHTPALTGACTTDVGSAVCTADVCDDGDDRCGYRNGEGPCDDSSATTVCRSAVCGSDDLCGYPDGEGTCTSVNAGVVCRSGLCSPNTHECVATIGCLIDTDCLSTQFCDTSVNACTQKLDNGSDLPVIAAHTPDLDGSCSSAVGHAVCNADVCDTADDKCGYLNGDGACDSDDAGAVCRSGVCGSDELCGYPNFEGDCSSVNAATVCRGRLCSPSSHVCVPADGCMVDADCAGDDFCNSETNQCAPKLPNDTAIPTIGAHDPELTGACSSSVGTAVCLSGVCDDGDDKCGYANGDGACDDDDATTVCRSGVCGKDQKCGYVGDEGSCTDLTAGSVCRSGLCSPTTFLCLAPSGCIQDSECLSTQFCDTSTNVCTLKLDNGSQLPTIVGHAPVLDGDCTSPVGQAVCSADVCDTADDRCGYLNGDGPCALGDAGVVCRSGVCGGDALCGYPDLEGPCTSSNAASVCRSGECSAVSQLCVPAGGCSIDADCSSAQFCNTASNRCVPKLDNGTKVPTIADHSPALSGACSSAVGKAVCSAGVCNAQDDKCGQPNGEGACTHANAAAVCRSGVCGSDDKCGLPDGEGRCSASNAGTRCRSGLCSPVSRVCIAPDGCAEDADCADTQFCDTAARQCRTKLSDGSAIPQLAHHEPALTGACTAAVGKAICRAGVCDAADDKCALANGDGPCSTDDAKTVCRSNACGEDGKCGYPDGEGTCTGMNAGTLCRTGACAEDMHTCGTPAASTGCTHDGDCASTQFCDTSMHACTQKLDDGAAIPLVDAHTPVLDGECNADVGKAVCRAATCDASDDRCAYANGTGPCTADDASSVCRSNVCGADEKCGLPDGEGPCTSMNASTVCRSSICTGAVCGPAQGCSADSDCDKDQFCDAKATQCKPRRPAEAQCSRDAQCQSDSCDTAAQRCNACVGTQCGRLKLAGGGFGCSAAQPGAPDAAPNSAFVVFSLLLLVTLARRTRRGERA